MIVPASHHTVIHTSQTCDTIQTITHRISIYPMNEDLVMYRKGVIEQVKSYLCSQPRKVMTTNVKTIGASKTLPPNQHLPRENGFQTGASEHRVWMRSGTTDVRPNIFQGRKETEGGRWDKVIRFTIRDGGE